MIRTGALCRYILFPLLSVSGFLSVRAQGGHQEQWLEQKNYMTFSPARRDSAGRLQPLQSYDETVRRAMDFVVAGLPGWFRGDRRTLLDERGIERPVYFYYSNLMYSGEVSKSEVDRFVSYPAFHHSLFIRTFVAYYRYTGDSLYLGKARELADWNIAHSTPASYPYGGMPYSTFEEGRPGGFRDGTCIMTDKAAIMALAYLQLYDETREKRYRDAARLIGKNLAANQSPEGNWPFRVDPRTREVKEPYTSSVIYAVELFERLEALRGGKRFRQNRNRALKWLLDGPVRTLQWRGFYEDIPEQAANRTNWDCIDVVRYLARHSGAHPEYLAPASRLCSFINDSVVREGMTFLSTRHPYAPAEAVREQAVCFVPMSVHSAHWAAMMRDMYRATGDSRFERRAAQTMNYITYHLQPNGIILLDVDYPNEGRGMVFNQFWFSIHFGSTLFLLEYLLGDGRSQ